MLLPLPSCNLICGVWECFGSSDTSSNYQDGPGRWRRKMQPLPPRGSGWGDKVIAELKQYEWNILRYPGDLMHCLLERMLVELLPRWSFEEKDLTGDVSRALVLSSSRPFKIGNNKFMSKYVKVGTVKKVVAHVLMAKLQSQEMLSWRGNHQSSLVLAWLFILAFLIFESWPGRHPLAFLILILGLVAIIGWVTSIKFSLGLVVNLVFP
nr:membrane steroid-binding protein 2-like [Ipomoea batatas]